MAIVTCIKHNEKYHVLDACESCCVEIGRQMTKEKAEIEARNHDQWVYPYKSVEEASIAMYGED